MAGVAVDNVAVNTKSSWKASCLQDSTGLCSWQNITYYLYVKTKRLSKMTEQVLEIMKAAETVN